MKVAIILTCMAIALAIIVVTDGVAKINSWLEQIYANQNTLIRQQKTIIAKMDIIIKMDDDWDGLEFVELKHPRDHND